MRFNIKTLNESFDRKFNTLLNEDIEAVKRQYSHIPSEEVDEIIRLDPTFIEGNDNVGTFGKWLLGLYNKIGGKYDKSITDLLTTYNQLKNDRTKVIERDINRLNSIEDLQYAIDNVQDAELSPKQKERELIAFGQKPENWEKVYEDDDWFIISPKCWEADVAWGKGSGWCTADSREELGKFRYYDYLKEGGKYYIIISKFKPTEKYQFHFESKQFFGAGTNVGHTKNKEYQIHYKDFIENWPNLLNFFNNEGYEDFTEDVDPDQAIREYFSNCNIENNIMTLTVSVKDYIDTIISYADLEEEDKIDILDPLNLYASRLDEFQDEETILDYSIRNYNLRHAVADVLSMYEIDLLDDDQIRNVLNENYDLSEIIVNSLCDTVEEFAETILESQYKVNGILSYNDNKIQLQGRVYDFSYYLEGIYDPAEFEGDNLTWVDACMEFICEEYFNNYPYNHFLALFVHVYADQLARYLSTNIVDICRIIGANEAMLNSFKDNLIVYIDGHPDIITEIKERED